MLGNDLMARERGIHGQAVFFSFRMQMAGREAFNQPGPGCETNLCEKQIYDNFLLVVDEITGANPDIPKQVKKFQLKSQVWECLYAFARNIMRRKEGGILSHPNLGDSLRDGYGVRLVCALPLDFPSCRGSIN
jgi:hypothetical protein